MILTLLRLSLARALLWLAAPVLSAAEWLLADKPDRAVPKSHANLRPADLMLLGWIVGVGIAGVWIGIVWRAA